MAWEALGAVIGAGFASGQEIAVFFARFGHWSPLAILCAMAAVFLLTRRILAMEQTSFRRMSWRIAFTLLAVVSGGAMAAAAGEIAALTLPFGGAKYAGMAAVLALSHLCAGRNRPLFRRLCQGMTAALVGMLCLCLMLPPQRTAHPMPLPARAAISGAALYGMSWAGFNLALAAPLLARRGSTRSPAQKRRAAWLLTLSLGALLALGCAVLLRHPLEMHAPLPLVRLTGRLGRGGFLLCCCAMVLAEISTLAAALEALRALLPSRALMAGYAAVALTALAGFGPVVSQLYPALGVLCTVLLLLPKEFALHSAQDVV